MGHLKFAKLKMGFKQNKKFNTRTQKGIEKCRKKNRGTYRVIVRCGGVGGKEDRKGGNEEKRKHGRNEDPEREQASKTRSTSSSSCSNRHWILNLAPKNVALVTVESRVRSKNLKNQC